MNEVDRGASEVFDRFDALLVCAVLRDGRTDPDLWTYKERAAITRLHGYRDGRCDADANDDYQGND